METLELRLARRAVAAVSAAVPPAKERVEHALLAQPARRRLGRARERPVPNDLVDAQSALELLHTRLGRLGPLLLPRRAVRGHVREARLAPPLQRRPVEGREAVGAPLLEDAARRVAPPGRGQLGGRRGGAVADAQLVANVGARQLLRQRHQRQERLVADRQRHVARQREAHLDAGRLEAVARVELERQSRVGRLQQVAALGGRHHQRHHRRLPRRAALRRTQRRRRARRMVRVRADSLDAQLPPQHHRRRRRLARLLRRGGRRRRARAGAVAGGSGTVQVGVRHALEHRRRVRRRRPEAKLAQHHAHLQRPLPPHALADGAARRGLRLLEDLQMHVGKLHLELLREREDHALDGLRPATTRLLGRLVLQRLPARELRVLGRLLLLLLRLLVVRARAGWTNQDEDLVDAHGDRLAAQAAPRHTYVHLADVRAEHLDREAKALERLRPQLQRPEGDLAVPQAEAERLAVDAREEWVENLVEEAG